MAAPEDRSQEALCRTEPVPREARQWKTAPGRCSSPARDVPSLDVMSSCCIDFGAWNREAPVASPLLGWAGLVNDGLRWLRAACGAA